MVLESFDRLQSGFEGCEKRLEVLFHGESLRRINIAKWSKILRRANCTILSLMRNAHCDAYILSESSLFVFDKYLILKTCGTTSLLSCLQLLLKTTASNDSFVSHFGFSRSNFLFPDSQPYPHKNFESETEYINLFFDGDAHIIGPLKGPRLNVFLSNSKETRRVRRVENGKKNSLELVMYNLDPEKGSKFCRRDSDHFYDGPKATFESGIQLLFPSAKIDSHLFSPCGYSCNALVGTKYFTIHVTPEPQCSFASFETNIPVKSPSNLVKKVIRIFNPSNFSVFFFSHPQQKESSKPYVKDFSKPKMTDNFWNFERYFRTTASLTEAMEGMCHIYYSNFKAVPDAKREEIRGKPLYGSGRTIDKLPFDNTMIVVNEENVVDEVKNLKDTAKSRLELSMAKKLFLSFLSERFFVRRIKTNDFHRKNKNSHGKVISDLISETEASEGFTVIDAGRLFELLYAWSFSSPPITTFYPLSYYSNSFFVLVLAFFGIKFFCFTIEELEILCALGVKKNTIVMENSWLGRECLEKALSLGIHRFFIDDEKGLKNLVSLSKKKTPKTHLYISVCLDFKEKENSLLKLEKIVSEMKESDSIIERIKISGIRNGKKSCDLLDKKLVIQISKISRFLEDICGCIKTSEQVADPLPVVFEQPGRAFLESLKKQISKRFVLEAEHAEQFVKPVVTHVVKIISAKKQPGKKGRTASMDYVVDDGIYQNFWAAIKHKLNPEVVPAKRRLRKNNKRKRGKGRTRNKSNCMYQSLIWGRTCDSMDRIARSVRLPMLKANDWLFFRGEASTSMNAATSFNGFADIKSTHYIMAEE